MKKIAIALAAAFMTIGTGTGASAGEVSGNVTVATDYSFRGWSQTTRDPAIQGGFDYGFESGLYIGTWASNLKYGDDASTEIDLYAGYGGEFGDGNTFDFSVIRFEYPSEGSSLDYMEIAGSIGIGSLTLGVNYSPAYLGEGGPTFFYPYIGYSWAPSDAASLDFQVGMSMAEEVGGPDEDSYMDYSVTLTIPTGGVDLGLAVVGTNLDEEVCGADCELRVIFSISKSM